MSLIKQPLIDRVKAQSTEEGDCWIWQGYTKGNMPMINAFVEGKWKCIAVRRAIKLEQGLTFWGKQHQARTTCGNPMCVNPEHIFLFQHKGSRGAKCNKQPRTPDQCVRIALSSRKHNAKLNWDLVNQIRSSSGTGLELSKQFGVSKTTINNIRAYVTWTTAQPSNPFTGLMK